MRFAVCALAAAACSLIPHPDVTIAVTIVNGAQTLEVGQSVVVTAQTAHTGGNPAVTWSLSGDGCPACGTWALVNPNEPNGVRYTAPAYVAAPTMVTLTATSVADPSKSASLLFTVDPATSRACAARGAEATLSGSYALLLRGGGANGPFALAGSFVADGAGGVVSGSLDVNHARSGADAGLTVIGAASSYSYGADGLGCLSLVTPTVGPQFRISLGAADAGVATLGRIIEFDDPNGMGQRAEGFVRRQEPSAFATSAVHGGYVFGLVGVGAEGGRLAVAGALDVDGGVVANGVADRNDGVAFASLTGLGGSYAATPTGRGTLVVAGATFATYAVSAARLIAIATDPVDATHPLLSGELVPQGAGPFDASALAGPAVVWTSGSDPTANGPTVVLGRVEGDGAGTASIVFDSNDSGAYAAQQSATTAYAVDARGRATLTFATIPVVAYLSGPGTGFLVGNDASVSFGALEAQSGGPFSNGSVTGRYFYGTEGAQIGRRPTSVGTLTVQGNVENLFEDDGTPMGLFEGLNGGASPISFAANGRGTLDASGAKVAYLISPRRLVFTFTTFAFPRVAIAEK